MSLCARNRMLQFLHKNGSNRKQVTIIMKDLEDSGIFTDPFEDYQDDCFFMEEKADIWFSDKKPFEKIAALKAIQEKINPEDEAKEIDYFLDIEARIRAKQNEYIKLGIVKPNSKIENENPRTITRYGRSPLHEAIAMRDLKTVKKLLKEGKYLTDRDNNGHTAMEMAFYESYTEALLLFARRIK